MTTEKKATFLRSCEGYCGDAALYEVDPPIAYGWDDEKKETRHVIVSAVNVPLSGPETYIFPADDGGEVLCWGELDGSYRGGLSHAEALAGAGYAVAAS